MAENDLKVQILKRIVGKFVESGKGTARRELIVAHRDQALPGILSELEHTGVVRNGGNNLYTPSLAAFHYAGNEHDTERAKFSFVVVGRILRDFYFEDADQRGIPFDELRARVSKADSETTDRTIELGLYLLGDMGLSGGSTSSGGQITHVNTSERLAVIPNLEQEWNEQVANRIPKQENADFGAEEHLAVQGLPQTPAIAGTLTSWERLSLLGSGGQSTVWLVRSPARQNEIANSIGELSEYQARRGNVDLQDRAANTKAFAGAIKTLTRDEISSDFGALKQFNIPSAEDEAALALARLRREIQVLSTPRLGMLKLLDSNEAGQWIVTEYFPQGSLEKQITLFKGNSQLALRAFRSLVQTVSALHEEEIVHRDIKPANVFVRTERELVLGDFGIVYLPEEGQRVTMTNERVGPRDYMPPWAPIDERQVNVKCDFDVYMLGKVLWCMIAGRLRLFREWHKRPEFNLENLFPKDPSMRFINTLLDACVTETQESCLKSAGQLLHRVDETLDLIEGGKEPLDGPRKCHVCRTGFYKSQEFALVIAQYDNMNRQIGTVRVVPFVCNFCSHFEFFAPGYPGRAAEKVI